MHKKIYSAQQNSILEYFLKICREINKQEQDLANIIFKNITEYSI